MARQPYVGSAKQRCAIELPQRGVITDTASRNTFRNSELPGGALFAVGAEWWRAALVFGETIDIVLAQPAQHRRTKRP
jgi:hypothetical protein